MTAGTRVSRTTKASRNTPAAKLKPIALMVGSLVNMNATKMENMIIAAARDHPGRQAGAALDRAAGVAVLGVLLLDPRDDEDLVVTGQAEDDRQHDDRQEADRLRRGDAEQVLAPAPLEDRDLRAERRGHREQEAQDRLDRHQDRPEGEREQDERQADHDDQEDRQRGRQLGRDVDVGRGGAADQDVRAGAGLRSRPGRRGSCAPGRRWPGRSARTSGSAGSARCRSARSRGYRSPRRASWPGPR